MPIYSFSTKPKQVMDTELVERLQQHCRDNGLSFSHLVLEGLKKLNEERKYVDSRA